MHVDERPRVRFPRQVTLACVSLLVGACGGTIGAGTSDRGPFEQKGSSGAPGVGGTGGVAGASGEGGGAGDGGTSGGGGAAGSVGGEGGGGTGGSSSGVTTLGFDKPRVLVLTDIGADPDDVQSLVRLLLYANELDLVGLCATSRDDAATVNPELLTAAIDAYGKVRDNLMLHADGWPSAAKLRGSVKSGLPKRSTAAGSGLDSPCSDAIIDAVDASAEPLWIPAWGGTRELRQALWRVQQDRNDADTAAFVAKLRVHAIADQDGHGVWIRSNFPELFHIWSGSCGTKSCQVFRGQYQTGDTSMQQSSWIDSNVRTDHGALGAHYPAGGGGVPGMKEGDTPSFTYLLRTGLQHPERPTWGGWGGRFVRESGKHYLDAKDELNGSRNERHTVSRWRIAFQRELQARLDWCVKSKSSANHPPRAVLEGDASRDILLLDVDAESTVTLDASGSIDPDGDALRFRYWHYEDADSFAGKIALEGSTRPKVQLEVPKGAAGQTIHLVLEVTDDGSPNLTSFRRAVLQVR